MLAYSLVVSDMDGTLLRNDKSVSERSLRAIRRFEEAGGRFTVATGRNVEAAGRYVKEMGLRTPLLLLNGCLIHDYVTGEDLLCRQIDRSILDQVFPILDEHGLNIIVHGPRRGVTRRMNETIAEHLWHDRIELDLMPDLGPASAGTVVKILTIGEPDVLDRTEAAIMAAGIPVAIVRSHPTYLEVLPQGGGKGTALEALLAHLQLPRERSLAVGDFLNDLDLVTTAGLGVAMANAHPGLKAVAGGLTASNEDDGVALLLEAILEGRPVGLAREALG